MDNRELNQKAHTLKVARDLAGRYEREAFSLERNLAKELDNGFYDLEDYQIEVEDGCLAIYEKEKP